MRDSLDLVRGARSRRRSARFAAALAAALATALLVGATAACSPTTAPATGPTTAEPVPMPGGRASSVPVDSTTTIDAVGPRVGATPASTVRTGAEVLVDDDFGILRGLRVGAIVNQTSLVRRGDERPERLIDLLNAAPDVDLAALFAPEHGIDGSLPAGAPLGDSVDGPTGLPVFSLYGATRQPTAAMFDGLDAVLFDLQDVGSRSYTYVSTMGLAMQTAAATGTTFVVLDRPNPLGGELVGGFTLDAGHSSFIGLYPMPQIHGLTVGEIASMIVGEGWLPGLDDLDLVVVDIEGWSRSQSWPDLGLEWVPPSPRLPTAESALFYAGTVLFAGTAVSDGSGTSTPFTLLGAPFVSSGDELVAALDRPTIGRGVDMTPARFTPAAIAGVSPTPLFEGITLDGIALSANDWQEVEPVAFGVALLVAFRDQSTAPPTIVTDPASFDRVAGTDALRLALERGETVEEILRAMAPSVDAFEALRRPYLRYR